MKLRDYDKFIIEFCDLFYWKFFLQPILATYCVSVSIFIFFYVSVADFRLGLLCIIFDFDFRSLLLLRSEWLGGCIGMCSISLCADFHTLWHWKWGGSSGGWWKLNNLGFWKSTETHYRLWTWIECKYFDGSLWCTLVFDAQKEWTTDFTCDASSTKWSRYSNGSILTVELHHCDAHDLFHFDDAHSICRMNHLFTCQKIEIWS